jgi:FkbM family methyltransferase
VLPSLRRVAKRILGPTLSAKLRREPEAAHSNDFYDSLSYQVMQRSLKADSISVDIGCHEGLFLQSMVKLSPEGRVYAFEPLPDMFRNLVTRFPSPRVILSDLALSDETGVVSFNHVVSNPGYSGLRKRTYDRSEEVDRTITVRTDRLDNVIPISDHIDFIKIDVEGAELQVLQGAVNTIRRCKPIVIFEHGLGAADCYRTHPGQVYALLRTECGLKISLLQQWLDKGASLSRKGFEDQFYNRKNFMFIAHPAKG